MPDKENKSTISASQVFDLEKLIDYGEGAVVSRTLVETEASTITLFAFDQGQGLSEHSTPFDALVQVLDGEGEFTIGGEAHTVAKGQIILMPANVPHAVRATRRFKMLLTMLRK